MKKILILLVALIIILVSVTLMLHLKFNTSDLRWFRILKNILIVIGVVILLRKTRRQ